DEDRSARSAWKVAHSKVPGPGITERASERPGKARKACFRRKFASSLRQRVPFIGKTPAADHESCRGPNSTGSRNWTKSSFLESSRRALQAALNRRIQGRRGWELGRLGRHSARWRRVPKTDAARPGGSRKKKDTRRTAAASRKTLGVLRRIVRRTRGELRRRQERAYDGRHPAGEGRRPSLRASSRPSRSYPSRPPPASGGRRRSPSGLALPPQLRAGPGRGASPAPHPVLLLPAPFTSTSPRGRRGGAGRGGRGGRGRTTSSSSPCASGGRGR
ncbi:hypothetical protein THAOC_37288, partial [Thalassiosira oceanica]